MTRKKPDTKFQCPPHEKRKHYACLLREFVRDAFKREVKRLNCSQGVYLEILLIKALENELVTVDDVFEYDALERSKGRIESMDWIGAIKAGMSKPGGRKTLFERYTEQLHSATEGHPLYKDDFGDPLKMD